MALLRIYISERKGGIRYGSMSVVVFDLEGENHRLPLSYFIRAALYRKSFNALWSAKGIDRFWRVDI